MRSHTMNTAVTLCAVALLTAGAGAASAAPVSPPTAHAVHQRVAHPVLVDCLWHPQEQPADFMLACGDGNSSLSSLHWSRWDRNSAVGKGLNVVNDCMPYCAVGKFHSYPVTVRLDHPEPWKKHPQQQHYTRMSLVYTNGRPDGSPRAVTYPLWN